MPVLDITKEVDIEHVAKNISSYRFHAPLAIDDLITLSSHLSPNEFNQLYSSQVLSNVQGVISLNVLKFLTDGTSLDPYYVVCNTKLDLESIDYVIENCNSLVDAEPLISEQDLSNEQLLKVLESYNIESAYSLGEAIGGKRDVEMVKLVLRNWSNLKFTEQSDNSTNTLKSFRSELFERLSTLLMNEEDQLEIFGFVRPGMSSNELRDHEPCSQGWRRVIKWAGRSDVKYSWNEFVARHILANINNVEDATCDIEWLSNCLSEQHEYFYY